MEPYTLKLNIAAIQPSRWQPRRAFDADALRELALSIQDQGLINPILVFQVNGHYELIAGERRTRAVIASYLTALFTQHSLLEWCARLATVGLAGMGEEERAALAAEPAATIQAAIYPADDMAALHLLAVTENLDRADLTPIEEAHAYQGLMQAYNWRQRELAVRVNKSQGYIAQRMSLLGLNEAAQHALNTRVIGLTEARAIAAVPEALQPAVTEWTVKAVSAVHPASTRDVDRMARNIAEFVSPNHWQPNRDRVYHPVHYNRLRILRHYAANGQPNAARLLALSEQTDGHKNLLEASPKEIIGYEEWLFACARALGAPSNHLETLLSESGVTCDTCVKNGAHWPKIPNMHIPCKQASGPSKLCDAYIGPDDPFVLELYAWDMVKIADELGLAHVGQGFHYVSSLEDFQTVSEKYLASQSVAKIAEKSDRHIAKIAAYYDWQAALPETWRQHIQAHACEKCLYYEPLNWAQGLPPCRFALNPWEPERAPGFGLLIAQDGQIAPRCEGFRYRDFDLASIAGAGNFRVQDATRLYHWMHEVTVNARVPSYYGPLYYIYHDNPPQEKHKFINLQNWLTRHWEMLADGRAAHILDVIISEGQIATASGRFTPILLLDITGDTRTWIVCPFPIDDYARYGWADQQWPSDWPKPWKK